MIIHLKIRKALSITNLVYDNYRTMCFENWCEIHAFNHALPLRALIKHDSLYNWYCHQWNTYVEEAFYNDFKDHIEAGVQAPEHYHKLFMDYPETIDTFYPAPLINKIKKALTPYDKSKLN